MYRSIIIITVADLGFSRRCANLLLPSATKLRRLCFYTCLSFCSQGGGCLPQCMPGYHPPPLRKHTHPWVAHPPGKHTPGKHTPTPPGSTPPEKHTPPGSTPPPGDSCRCRRYAFYWNAFLFGLIFAENCMKMKKKWMGALVPTRSTNEYFS